MTPRPRPQYDGFETYKAGKPIEEVARDLGLSRIVKLASNENPYTPAPAVDKAIRAALLEAHRYPDDSDFEVSRAIAAFHGVAPENVLMGAGSTDIITYAWRVMAGPGDHGVYPWPSFVMYPIAGVYAGSLNVEVPLHAGRVDLDALLSAALSKETRIVVVCNPNNPTGTYVSHDDVLSFLDAVPEHVLVINDEAYHEYADAADYPHLVPGVLERPNVIVTRTFSKVYGLAGLRVGYAFGAAPLCAELRKGRNPFTVSRVAQVAGTEALRHQDEVSQRAKENASERDRMLPELTSRGFAALPTQANFVYVTAPDSRDWFDMLLHRGVIVRQVPGGLRITFGTPEENDFLLEQIDSIKMM